MFKKPLTNQGKTISIGINFKIKATLNFGSFVTANLGNLKKKLCIDYE